MAIDRPAKWSLQMKAYAQFPVFGGQLVSWVRLPSGGHRTLGERTGRPQNTG